LRRVAFWLNRSVVLGTVLLLTGNFARAEVKKPETKHASKPVSAKAGSSAHHSAKSTAHSRTLHRTSHYRRRRYVRRHKSSWRYRGQQRIAPERAEQIQKALIQAHYLKGSPTGKWDSQTQEALRKYQADHNWQTKVVPDARALISLGLGPESEHLLNPNSAMTSSSAPRSVPASGRIAPVSSTSGSNSNAATPGDAPDSSISPSPHSASGAGSAAANPGDPPANTAAPAK
jgi:Putative peptidoglycan binding domain